jgi:hypothetical protein
MRIPPQQDAKIIEPSDDSLQFHAIDQENSDRRFVLADVIEKDVLHIL